MSLKDAFNSSANEYDKFRRQLIPCFDEFYGTVVKLVPFRRNEKISVLDLGAGTGLLTHWIIKAFPNALFYLVDFAEEMLLQAKKRFQALIETNKNQIHFYSLDYSKLDLKIEGKTFDLIVSSLSIHHLTPEDKHTLFSNIFSALNAKGMFINADLCLGETEEIESAYQRDWLNYINQSGLTHQQIQEGIERSKYDKKDTLVKQLQWLKQIGFKNVNCWYMNYSFSVYSGQKIEEYPS